MGSAYQFHSWRVFVLVCAFPAVAAIAALNTMPESPRFYLEVSDSARFYSQNNSTIMETHWVGQSRAGFCKSELFIELVF